jgi:hypothetical protein
MCDDVEQRRPLWSERTIDRRAVLGGILLSASGGLTGCLEVANWIADTALGEVNVFNETSGRIHGSLTIGGPDGSTVLSESFALEGQTDDTPNSEAMVAYRDVWGPPGEYHVTIQLEEGDAVRGERRAESTVEIDTPDEQMLGVGLGVTDREAGIVTLVATEWSGFTASRKLLFRWTLYP